MSRNNASFAATAAAFHNAHVSKLKTLNAEPFISLTKDGNVTQTNSIVDPVTANATKGKITMQAVIGPGDNPIFQFNNRYITEDSKILLSLRALTTSGDSIPCTWSIATQTTGACTIMIKNSDTTASTDAPPVIHYLIVD